MLCAIYDDKIDQGESERFAVLQDVEVARGSLIDRADGELGLNPRDGLDAGADAFEDFEIVTLRIGLEEDARGLNVGKEPVEYRIQPPYSDGLGADDGHLKLGCRTRCDFDRIKHLPTWRNAAMTLAPPRAVRFAVQTGNCLFELSHIQDG
jgi:hypothetical protein